MAPAIVQFKRSTTPTNGWNSGGGTTVVLDSTPTPGNEMVAFSFIEGGSSALGMTSSGWTLLGTVLLNSGADRLEVFTKTAGASESTTVMVGIGPGGFAPHLSVFEISGGSLVSSAILSNQSVAPTLYGTAVTPTVDPGLIMAAFMGKTKTYTGPAVWTPTSPMVADYSSAALGRGEAWVGHIATTTGSYTPTLAQSGLDYGNTGNIVLLYQGSSTLPPVADFTADNVDDIGPYTVTFTDLSTNTPTSWAWDFGDGGTSTSQNPSHLYTVPGVYTVSLTATNADGSDTETKTSYISVDSDVDYEAPPPGAAILEIKATPPGADRWDDALWDEARWSSASWQDVTPYGVEVDVTWGSSRPEFGILSTPNAATWAVSFYDPGRVLDPANEDSPYFGDIEPMLPVRLRHGETVIKQGYLESASHSFTDDTGYWRVMDIQAVLANAVVPADTTLSDTLFARTRDAIAAAGLAITVANDPPSGDPALAPWVTQQGTVWDWVSDAAQQVLWVPYVRADNTLSFRQWSAPLNRGRVIGSPNLVGLSSLVMHNGLFSIVGALELISEGTDIVRRELTPKPRYGAREYLRTEPTPDSGDWAQAVLDDRATASLRWLPGRVVPFTASEAEYFATLEAIEQVSLSYPESVPPVIVDGIIVGGEIHVRGKRPDDATWSFLYHVAQIPPQPLTEDGDPLEALVRDDDPTEYLYVG